MYGGLFGAKKISIAQELRVPPRSRRHGQWTHHEDEDFVRSSQELCLWNRAIRWKAHNSGDFAWKSAFKKTKAETTRSKTLLWKTTQDHPRCFFVHWHFLVVQINKNSQSVQLFHCKVQLKGVTSLAHPLPWKRLLDKTLCSLWTKEPNKL